MINIRAHHLLCMKYFKKKGYSKEFVLNFCEVMKVLKDNPVVRIIDNPDIICGACPHNDNGKCIKKGPNFENEIKEKDNKVMKHLEIKPNTKIKIIKARNLVDHKLEKTREICKECEWLEYCY